jgi:hypothetical protein
VTAREQIALLRAVAEGDLDRHTELRDDFHAAGRLADYENVLAAAFQVAVGKRLPVGYRHQDVVDLIAEARIATDPTCLALDPSHAELIVRSVLDHTVDPAHLPDSAFPLTCKLVCHYLATRRRLGDPDTFMTEAGEILDNAATRPHAPRRRREATAEDAAVLAGILIGLLVGAGAATVLGAVAARFHRPKLPR